MHTEGLAFLLHLNLISDFFAFLVYSKLLFLLEADICCVVFSFQIVFLKFEQNIFPVSSHELERRGKGKDKSGDKIIRE